MSSATEFEALLEQLEQDRMILRTVVVEAEDVVFLKSIIEAYPGVAAVHAERRQAQRAVSGVARPRTLVVATTPGLGAELDHLLDSMRGELALVIDGVSSTPPSTPPEEDRAAR
ncbi:MAG: hypothetical protein JRI68_08180 [Deltaproteobacteria bacterium]|nr:hypothetical protein [Deltaproteobacteria bacterium]